MPMDLFAQTIVDGLALGSSYALLAIGFALVFNVSGVLNVAHPAFYMLGAYSAALVLGIVAVGSGLIGLLTGISIGVAAGVVAAVVLHVGVIRRLGGSGNLLAAFIATLGVASALEYGVARLVGARERFFPNLTGFDLYHLGPVAVSNLQLLLIASTALIALGLFWWVRRTNMGREIRAVSENETGAAVMGIRVDRVKLVTLCVASGIAGYTGVILSNQYGVITPFMGAELAFRMFVIVLVAGTGSLATTLFVGLGLGIVEAMTVQYVGSLWQQFAGLTVLVAVLMLRPEGISGRHVRAG